MAFHNVYQADIKSDLYGLSLSDGQVVTLWGNTARGDIAPIVYLWDGASSATDNFPEVVNPTGHMGNGRYIRQYPDQVKGNWSEAVTTALAFIQNKPSFSTVATSGSYNDLSDKPTPFVPSGALFMWGTNSAPSGYLICDGSAVSRTTNSILFGLIGTTFGVGDTTTTFNIPDFRQRFPLGKAASGTGNALAATGGIIDHIHAADPPSTSSSSDGSHNHGGATGNPSATVAATNLTGTAANAVHTHSISTDGAHTHTINVASFNTDTANPPYLVINYIIKT